MSRKYDKRIPDGMEVIDCIIETPQFKGCQEVFTMYKQRGIFYKKELKFIHSGIFFGHDVQFQNLEDFKDALIKVI